MSQTSVNNWHYAASLVGHKATVLCLSTTKDERLVASSSSDGTVRVWDRKTAKGIRNWNTSDGSIRELRLLNGGQAVAAAGFTECTVWSVASGDVMAKFKADQFVIASSPAGRLLAIGTELGEVALVDAESFRILATVPALEGGVSALSVSPDETFVLAAGGGAVVKINVARRQCDWKATGHNIRMSISRVLLNNSLGQVISCSYDDSARIWDLQTGKAIAVLQHPDRLSGATVSPDGRCLFTHGNKFHLWDTASWTIRRTITEESGIEKSHFSPGGECVLAACGDGSIRIWDVDNGLLLQELGVSSKPINDFLLCEGGKEIVACGDDPKCAIWRRTS